jgi:two-component system heavy metal sensor histidine kinase CusS
MAAFSQGRIQLARDVTDERWMLRRLRNAILLVFLLAPAAAALMGFWLVRLGLAPLGSLVHALDRLRPETLKTRVDPATVPSELVPLSDALNLALERLESAFGRLSELNGDLAHELRTPLHALRLEVEDLIGRPGFEAAVLDRLGGMMETLEHMGAVIEQMLTLARLEDPSRQLEKVLLEADGLLASSVAPFESLAEEAGVRVQVETEPGLAFPGNGLMLRRALHNLLANALRHSARDGAVHLRAREAGATVILEVEDQGEGMPETVQAQLGRRFLRPDASRSRSTGGTGLGLAIVQGIAHLHGGRLEVQSRKGLGTVIQIILPRT